MVEQNAEIIWFIGSNPILGNSFDFGEERHMLREGKIWDLMKLRPIQVSNVLEITNRMGIE